jgi:hypothetical protein
MKILMGFLLLGSLLAELALTPAIPYCLAAIILHLFMGLLGLETCPARSIHPNNIVWPRVPVVPVDSGGIIKNIESAAHNTYVSVWCFPRITTIDRALYTGGTYADNGEC